MGRHPGSIYQAIKKEIRNCLNPYRIFIEKEAKTSEQLKELCNLLKSYFKEKNFNNTFFINYFKDLEKAHKKKSKYLSMLPSDEVEVLNDLQRKVAIIRALRHYVSTTIRDRIQINYDKKKGINMDDDDFTMMYEYLVINPKEYSNMDYSTLSKYISNERGSFKLRRPLNDFNTSINYEILIDGCLNAGVPISAIGSQSHQHQGYQREENAVSRLVQLHPELQTFQHS